LNKALKKYLQTRTAQGHWQLSGIERSVFRAAIVIPCLAEAESLPKTLASLAANPSGYLQQTLLIIVVNNRPEASYTQKKNNRATLDWLAEGTLPQLNLNWVDAASPGLELPAKEGVGQARKIGFDLALSRLDWENDPLLISLDADTLVDENYLPAIFRHFSQNSLASATIPFRHQQADDPQQERAIRLYELYLRSYLFGLQQSGSPYAYHTIGSAFACRASAYLAVGGMNRRHAAEDFYFLQQLAKHSGVAMLTGTVVRPSPRFSERVPFGTGKAVQGQVEEGRQLFQFSSVEAFTILRHWLSAVENSLLLPAERVLQQLGNDVLIEFLRKLNFAANWELLQLNYPDLEKRHLAFHCWFDGLRTRQLLTRLDAEQERMVDDTVRQLLAWGGYPEVFSREAQLQLLEKLQSANTNTGAAK